MRLLVRIQYPRQMKLIILGTGTFFVNKDRSASAYLLEIDDKKILIDNKSIVRVYYKKHTIQKKNKEYNGLVRIIIKRSSWLNRQIYGLIEGIYINAPSSNGRTPDFESGYCGSNPCGATDRLKMGVRMWREPRPPARPAPKIHHFDISA